MFILTFIGWGVREWEGCRDNDLFTPPEQVEVIKLSISRPVIGHMVTLLSSHWSRNDLFITTEHELMSKVTQDARNRHRIGKHCLLSLLQRKFSTLIQSSIHLFPLFRDLSFLTYSLITILDFLKVKDRKFLMFSWHLSVD